MAIVKGVRIDFPYVKVTAAPSGGGSIVASTDKGWVEGTARGDHSARYGTWIITESAMGAIHAEAAAVVESLVKQGYRVVDHRSPDWVLEQADSSAPEVDDIPYGFGLVEPPQARLGRWLQGRLNRED